MKVEEEVYDPNDPYADILERGEYTYNGDNSMMLEPLIPLPEKEKEETSLWSDIKVGAEVGSSVGQFVSNNELYGSNTYNTTHKRDPEFDVTSPEVHDYLTGLTPTQMEGVEDSMSWEHMELIVSRNKYDDEVTKEYSEAGTAKYLGLVSTMVADPINVIPLAGAFKLLNSAKSLTKVAGYTAVGAATGAADEALRGAMQQTDSSIGSGAFWGGALGLGLGGVSHLLSRSINKQGAAESMLDPQASTKAAKVDFMYTPTQKLIDSGSNEYSKLGKALNRGPINKVGEVVEETANDIKYNILNQGAQSEAKFKDAYKLAIAEGYSGTYDDYLEDGIGEIIGSSIYLNRESLQPVPTNEFHTSDVLDARTADRSAGGNVKYADLSPHFVPLQEAMLENSNRLSKYLDEVLPEGVTTFKAEAGEKLTELNNSRHAIQNEINTLKKEGKDTLDLEIELKNATKEFTKIKREVELMTDATKLKASLTQGASNLTKYYTIKTQAIANMSLNEFTNTIFNGLTHVGTLPKGLEEATVILSITKAHKEIVAKYTRGDTENFIINQMTTFNEDPLFSTLISKLNPLDVKGIMFSDAGIASHYFHTELAGKTGLVSKGLPLNDSVYRDEILEEIAAKAMKNDGISAEEARALSTQALDLYRQIRGDYMPMPSAGGYGQAVKAFNNITYSAVGGGFGVLSVMDIAVGVTANGFKNTLKSMGPGFSSMIKQVRGQDPKAIQEALQLGAGGDMMMGSLKSRFFELDGVATTRTMAKTMDETTNSLDKFVAGTDYLADKVSTVSGLRHVSSWLQYTAMYASMGKIVKMAKQGTLSAKEVKWLEDKGLTQADIQAIPTDKMKFDDAGNPLQYNFTEWGEETMELQRKMTVASNRAVNNAVIKADVTELPNWFNNLSSSPAGSMLTAFLKYVVASHGSIMKRGYYGDKAAFFSGIAVAGSLLMMSKVMKEEALVASGLIEEKDRKYRIFDSRGNLDEEGLTKLALDTVSYLPQMGAISLGVDTLANWANTDLATGEAKYSGNQTRILGNFNNVLGWGKYFGKALQGEVNAIDSLYQFKSATPFSNMWYMDQMYMPKVKDALE